MATRDTFVACVRARAILDALACLRFGYTEATFEGNAQDGFYVHHDGSGNHHVVAWSADGVVAIENDHDRGELDEDWLDGLVGLRALRDRVIEHGDQRATGGLWIRGAKVVRDGEIEQLAPYLRDVREAVEAWSEVESLSREDRELVVLLEAASRDKACDLTRDQQQQLLERGEDAAPVTPRGAAMGAEILARLGIAWPDARAKATATKQTAAERAAAKLGAPQVALLEAVYARDLEATRAALDAGANPDCETYKGQFGNMHFVESPLVLATRLGDEAVALLLIERGASLHAAGDAFLHPALDWALLRGRVRVVRELLARGVPVPTASFPNRHIVEGARQGPGSAADFAACMRALFDGGAPPADAAWCAGLIAVAEAAGAQDLVRRLRIRPPDPRHVHHQLPAPPPLPPLPAADGPREALVALLERATDRAGNPIGARTALMDAWRLSRHPRIADAIEVWDGTSGDRDVIARRRDRSVLGATMVVQGFDSALLVPAQPVAGRNALDFVEHGAVPCTGCFDRCMASAAAVLVHVADVRGLEGLKRVLSSPTRGYWSVFGAPPPLLAAMEALSSFRFAELDEEASALLTRVEEVAVGRVLPAPNVVALGELYRAVYAAPDDDTPRVALAERLGAVGDPRGEFITLQLERHRAGSPPTRREQDLVRERGRAWLGDIAWAVRDEALAFERGFVARAFVGRSHEDLKSWPLGHEAPVRFGDEEEWSTVEQLSAGWHRRGVSGLLASTKLRSLREVVDLLPLDLDQVLAGAPKSWTSLGTYMTRSTDWWMGAQHAARLEPLPDVLPHLASLSFGARDLSGDLVARTVARLPRLQDLSLAYRWDGLPELTAIAREHDLRTVRLLLLRVGKHQQTMRGPGDLAVDVETRVITLEMPGVLDDTVALGVAYALRGVAEMQPTELVVALPPSARPEGADPVEPELPATFVRKRERMILAPIWAVARQLGVPCRVGAELVAHWSPCEEALK